MTRTLCVTSRSCSVLLDPDGLYEAREKHVLYLDGERLGEEYRSVASLFDLEPDTEYELQIENGKVKSAVTETMVNGNLGELVKNIRAVSRETCCDGSTVLPYLAADGVVISGK